MVSAAKLGKWSAIILISIGMLYLLTGIIGAFSGGDFWPPRQVDPWLAIMEFMIMISGPFMIVMMLAIHFHANESTKIYSLAAVSFMIISASFTAVIQFLRLTVLRKEDAATTMAMTHDLFLFADLLAWDLFFGLSMVFGAFVFWNDPSTKTVFRTMFLSGSLCLIGFLGPVTGYLQLQSFAIVGYTVMFVVVCIFLAKFFSNQK
jgi:hypothetical protein